MWWNCVRLDLRSSERCDIDGLKEETKRRKPLQHNRVPSQLSTVVAVTSFGFLLHWKPTGSLLHPLQPACVVREIRLLGCVDSETLGGARFCVKEVYFLRSMKIETNSQPMTQCSRHSPHGKTKGHAPRSLTCQKLALQMEERKRRLGFLTFWAWTSRLKTSTWYNCFQNLI